MPKLFYVPSLVLLAVIGLTLAGCNSQSETPNCQPAAGTQENGTQSTPNETHDGHAMGQHMHETHGGNVMGESMHESTGEFEDALSKLSPEDRALAEQQKVCPVSGAKLGSMGTPIKVTVEGQDVMLCCPGCEAAIKADPEKYLAKLHKDENE